jgi:dTDP-4-amino-4,6-dideoxygalactose transaminase
MKQLQVSFNNVTEQYHQAKRDIYHATKKVMNSGQYIAGEVESQFDDYIARAMMTQAGAGVGSGTMAILLALLAVGVKPGDEVIVPSLTFIGTVDPIVNIGAVPIFVDVNDTYHIDPALIIPAITEKTKAIIAVDIYGQSCNVCLIRAIADRHNLKFIIDGAHSFGVSNTMLPDLVTYSFNPVKNLGAMGDAGAVVGRNKYIYIVKQLRNHGRDVNNQFNIVGHNARLDNLQAAVIMAKHPYLSWWNERRKAIAKMYDYNINHNIETPIRDGTHVYYSYVIQTDKRDQLKVFLASKGIETKIQYTPCHHYPSMVEYKDKHLPNTDEFSERMLSIPMHSSLDDQQVQYIIEQINTWSINV